MTSIFIVRAEDGGTPESIIYGVYPTKELADARIRFLQIGDEFGPGHEYAWYDEVIVGPNGADCEFYNG